MILISIIQEFPILIWIMQGLDWIDVYIMISDKGWISRYKKNKELRVQFLKKLFITNFNILYSTRFLL